MSVNSLYKKGVSDVVATVLIIMITIAVIAIVWIGIMPMIRNSLSVGSVCGEVDLAAQFLLLEKWGIMASQLYCYLQLQAGLSSNSVFLGKAGFDHRDGPVPYQK